MPKPNLKSGAIFGSFDKEFGSLRRASGVPNAAADRGHGLKTYATIALSGVLLVVPLGCQTTPGPSPAPKTISRVPLASGGQPAPAQTLTPDQIVANDPCATRLHDIAGALLLYYALNKQLPPRLEDLRSMADVGDEDLKFTCPASGLPYVYVPSGLHVAGRNKRIIIHDGAPSHNGSRWCIFLSPAKPGAAQAVEVLVVPEGIFRTYLISTD